MATTYRINVKTGSVIQHNEQCAGTNAKVYITLYGDAGSSDEIQLDNPHKNDFEANNFDTFSITTSDDLGALGRIRIRHDNTGGKPGWFLEYITIRNESREQDNEWNFPCHRWLAVDEDDGVIDRYLDRA